MTGSLLLQWSSSWHQLKWIAWSWLSWQSQGSACSERGCRRKPGSCVVKAWVIRWKRYVLRADDDNKLRSRCEGEKWCASMTELFSIVSYGLLRKNSTHSAHHSEFRKAKFVLNLMRASGTNSYRWANKHTPPHPFEECSQDSPFDWSSRGYAWKSIVRVDEQNPVLHLLIPKISHDAGLFPDLPWWSLVLFLLALSHLALLLRSAK